jgi:hypothetical protein
MRYSTPRRNGLTMAEVLIALFTTALGLMAILTLFPLGAAQMAQAIKDDRCAHAANLATAEARILWRQLWENGTAMNEPFVKAMDNPDADSAPNPQGYPNRAGNPGRSYPGLRRSAGLQELCQRRPAPEPILGRAVLACLFAAGPALLAAASLAEHDR